MKANRKVDGTLELDLGGAIISPSSSAWDFNLVMFHLPTEVCLLI
jgi:hypothetical protein